MLEGIHRGVVHVAGFDLVATFRSRIWVRGRGYGYGARGVCWVCVIRA
jgi:hypothetical protein